jgi:hypothetical protein
MFEKARFEARIRNWRGSKFIDENGGGPGIRLCKRQNGDQPGVRLAASKPSAAAKTVRGQTANAPKKKR